MRHIQLQPSGNIPRDDEFHFRSRAKASPEAGPDANGTPSGSSPTLPSIPGGWDNYGRGGLVGSTTNALFCEPVPT